MNRYAKDKVAQKFPESKASTLPQMFDCESIRAMNHNFTYICICTKKTKHNDQIFNAFVMNQTKMP